MVRVGRSEAPQGSRPLPLPAETVYYGGRRYTDQLCQKTMPLPHLIESKSKTIIETTRPPDHWPNLGRRANVSSAGSNTVHSRNKRREGSLRPGIMLPELGHRPSALAQFQSQIEFLAPMNLSSENWSDHIDPNMYEVVTEMSDREFAMLGFPVPSVSKEPPMDFYDYTTLETPLSEFSGIEFISRKYARLQVAPIKGVSEAPTLAGPLLV